MWKMVFGSSIGISHSETGKPCQDYCTGRIRSFGNSEFLVASCSDGAGSAQHSESGAFLASETFLSKACDWLGEDGKVDPPSIETVISWVDAARAELISEADLLSVKPRDMACTLIGVLVSADWVVFAQIGDGGIVFVTDENYEIAFWPDNGEYANVTFFLSEVNYKENLKVDIIHKHVSAIALFTDGLQNLALDFVNSEPYARFFKPLFKTVQLSSDDLRLKSELDSYLSSDRMNQRTDDDKSLLLATRI